MFSDRLQRSFDCLVVVLFSFIWVPVLLVSALLVKIFDGSPVFFFQERVGCGGRGFKLIKLRTMSTNVALPENLRVTSIGRILRRTSLDEVPQLINVLLGDMSLVGPRPLPLYVLKDSLSKEEFNLRASVKPGLTGYSQVQSRGVRRDLLEKVRLDFFFIENRSVYFYWKILILTFRVVFLRFFGNKSGETL